MTVWIIIEFDYDDAWIRGVFLSEKEAAAAKCKLKNHGGGTQVDVRVEEWEVR